MISQKCLGVNDISSIVQISSLITNGFPLRALAPGTRSDDFMWWFLNCWMRCGPAGQRRSGCRRDRTRAALHAARRNALVDPLRGWSDRIFTHHDPEDLDGVRSAATSLGDLQAVERPAIRRQDPRYCRPLFVAAQPGACAQCR